MTPIIILFASSDPTDADAQRALAAARAVAETLVRLEAETSPCVRWRERSPEFEGEPTSARAMPFWTWFLPNP